MQVPAKSLSVKGFIRHAEVEPGRIADVRIWAGVVDGMGVLTPGHGDWCIDANGAALLPGLHDHHLHLFSLASSLASVDCAEHGALTAPAFTALLRSRAAMPRASRWLRVVSYHESIAGELDRDWLDQVVPHVPVRVQHRSGRLWVLNSQALRHVQGDLPEQAVPGERQSGHHTGRFYDADAWMRTRTATGMPPLREVSELLSTWGVTGVTDASPDNGVAEFDHFVSERERGHLLQEVLVMGSDALWHQQPRAGVLAGPRKFHHHGGDLPDFEVYANEIRAAHSQGRPIAVHCVTLSELMFTLCALQHAGPLPGGDRIEHASVVSPDALSMMAGLGLTVVTQPNFVLERGDAYAASVDTDEQPWLYRLRSLMAHGIPLGGGTDAPFGRPSPWVAMEAAVRRKSRSGLVLGLEEALTPEEALALFLSAPGAPGGPARRIEVGAPANLCLIDRSWAHARRSLAQVRVAATVHAFDTSRPCCYI